MNGLARRVEALLETLTTDRRARIAGVLFGAVMLMVSFGFLAASKAGLKRPAASRASHLPAAPLDVPILRVLPGPEPRKGGAAERASPPSRTAKARHVTARR